MKYDFITVLDRTGADSIAANIDPWGVSPAWRSASPLDRGHELPDRAADPRGDA